MSKEIKALITSDKYKNQFAMVLPKVVTPERFVRVALTALVRVPNLNNCTQASLMGCLLEAAAMGLEVDGRRAHLIPYGNTCTLIIDYKGLVELAMRSGLVSHIHADIVCYNDEFEENLGRVVKHKINRKAARGDMYAVYSHVVMKDGTESFQVMSKDEVDAIRSRSKASKSGPWVTDYNEMAKKTAFRRHAKWLPLSPELRDALDKDQDTPVDITSSVEIVEPEVMTTPDLKDGKALDKPKDKPKTNKPKRTKAQKAPEPPPEPEPDPEPVQDPEAPVEAPEPAEERPPTADEWEAQRERERDEFVEKAARAAGGEEELKGLD